MSSLQPIGVTCDVLQGVYLGTQSHLSALSASSLYLHTSGMQGGVHNLPVKTADLALA
jgi:hypothetical protein